VLDETIHEQDDALRGDRSDEEKSTRGVRDADTSGDVNGTSGLGSVDRIDGVNEVSLENSENHALETDRGSAENDSQKSTGCEECDFKITDAADNGTEVQERTTPEPQIYVACAAESITESTATTSVCSCA